MKRYLFLLAILVSVSSANAAEVRVITSGAMRDVAETMAAEFGAANGHAIEIVSRPVAGVVEMVQEGERADIVMTSDAGLEAVIATGDVDGSSARRIGFIGIGVAVREGAPQPRIGTVEEFRTAMLEAESIAYMNPALGISSGIALTRIFEELGIAEEIAPKAVILGEGLAAEHIAAGEAEIGLQNMTQLIGVEGVAIVGPLPPEIQDETGYMAAVATNSDAKNIAAEFIAYLTRPEAQAIWRESGFSSPR
jgi:molybdate transport system substrate-binding protein